MAATGAAVTVLICSVTALAGGGNSIATAAALPIGVPFTGGGIQSCSVPSGQRHYNEYRRVSLRGGDRLTLKFGGTASYVDVHIYAPKTDDYTLDEMTDLGRASASQGGKSQLLFTAGGGGSYIVGTRTNGCDTETGYDMLAIRQVRTVASIKPIPAKVKPDGRVTLRGRVQWGTGKALVTVSGAGAKPQAAPVTLGSAGRFSISFRVGPPGRYRASVSYRENSAHLASAASTRFAVG